MDDDALPSAAPLDRRQFLQATVAVGAALAAGGAAGPATEASARVIGLTVPPMPQVRIGVVGTGNRGTSLIRDLLKVDGAVIAAVCDVLPDAAERARASVEKSGQPAPTVYAGDEHIYRKLCNRDDIDLVINATPWQWHVPIAVEAMRAGRHVAIEVPAAVTVEECWQLVETAEQTRRHCVMLENCCYGESELMVLNMVRAGLFGQLTHGEGAYLHELKEAKFGRAAWRLAFAERLNGNLYPTHGLGPIAQYMSINRGDRFERLVSMSSPSIGLKQYARETFGPGDPRAQRNYAMGDINTSLIRTARGLTILLQYDTTTPRPYSRINLVSGTKGVFTGYPDRVAFSHDDWQDAAPYRRTHQHFLWKQLEQRASGAGHGGMDFVMCWRLIDRLKRGKPLDHDVYDAAAWSAVMDLSVRSVAGGGETVDCPDFTRGAWKTRPPFEMSA